MNKILVFGSLNQDDVYRVEHFVRPGESLIVKSYQNFPGGKGLNQAVAAAKAGAKTYISGKIGADGASLVQELQQQKIDTTYLDQTGSRTGRAIIQVEDGGQNSILVDPGANEEIEHHQLEQAISAFDKQDILVTQNETGQTIELLRAANKQGLKVAFNPSPINERVKECDLSQVTWLFINEIEGYELTGAHEAEQITAKLCAQYQNLRVVLTLGKEGVRYQDKNEVLTHGVYPVEVVDTTAAGDTFTGFFLGALLQGKDVSESLELASMASSLAVSRSGASSSIPTMQEVLQYRSALK